MQISELIESLESIKEDYGDVEVRLAFQPSWPLQYHIGRIETVDLAEPDPDDYTDENVEGKAEEPPTLNDWEPEYVVYIGEGGQLYDAPYLPGIAAATLGWR